MFNVYILSSAENMKMCSAIVKMVKQEKALDSVTEMLVLQRHEPEHFLLRVESFSESKMEKYESDEFEAGGYKWRLILYPNGDNSRKGSSHISLYLSISDTQNLPSGWKVEADFSLFLYNSISQNYRTYKSPCKTWFTWLNTDSGFARLMPLGEFKETSNGYLFGDACVFGAEIHVTDFGTVAKRQTLSIVKKNDAHIFTWTVKRFSTLSGAYYQSEKFTIGEVQWNLLLNPNASTGLVSNDKNSISIFLVANKVTKHPKNRKVDAAYKLRIRNQLNSNHLEKQDTHIFACCLGRCRAGFDDFFPLGEVNDESKGFLKNDILVVGVEFVVVKIID